MPVGGSADIMEVNRFLGAEIRRMAGDTKRNEHLPGCLVQGPR